jgi:alkaline phosphatase D
MYYIYVINKDYKVLEKSLPTIGIWDDHDYAINDGNKYYKYKESIKELYLNFISEPQNSLRRTVGRGIYTSYSFGTSPSMGHQNFRIILLDDRYERDSMFDENPDVLGELQWTWLEDILKNNRETFTFIMSGIQILPPTKLIVENWFTGSRKRLFDLIGKLKKEGVVFLTGDVHVAQILKTYCVLPEIGYHLYEITSSGLSHFFYYKILFDYVLPSSEYNLISTIEDYNFAKINFEWGKNKSDSKVEFQIKNADNILLAQLKLAHYNLSYSEENLVGNDPDCYRKITSKYKSLKECFKFYLENKSYIIFLIPYLWIVIIIYYTMKMLKSFTLKLYSKIIFFFSCQREGGRASSFEGEDEGKKLN